MPPINAESLYQALLAQIRQAYGADLPALAGIHSGGAWLAERLARDLGAPAYGVVNVALHRDDYAKKGLHSQASPTQLPFAVEGASILLVDDVLYTGRTIRAAVNELYDYGRPGRIDLAVLVDRGGRELPIGARFVGQAIELDGSQTLVLEQDPAGQFSFRLEAGHA